MVARADALLGQPVLHRRFEELDFDAEFDGIWACASLLHVPRAGLPDVLDRLAGALVPGGVLFASFKYGDGEREHAGRLFTSYDEAAFGALVAGHPALKLIRVWRTEDVRPGREGNIWLDALVHKSS